MRFQRIDALRFFLEGFGFVWGAGFWFWLVRVGFSGETLQGNFYRGIAGILRLCFRMTFTE
ncbi:MAG: hypothetical protein ACP5M4_03020 [Acidobacteriaceae bacterium]